MPIPNMPEVSLPPLHDNQDVRRAFSSLLSQVVLLTDAVRRLEALADTPPLRVPAVAPVPVPVPAPGAVTAAPAAVAAGSLPVANPPASVGGNPPPVSGTAVQPAALAEELRSSLRAHAGRFGHQSARDLLQRVGNCAQASAVPADQLQRVINEIRAAGSI